MPQTVDQQTLYMLIEERLNELGIPAFGAPIAFEWKLPREAANYVFDIDYDSETADFGSDSLWLNWYASEQIRAVADLIEELFGDELSDTAKARIGQLRKLLLAPWR